MGTQAFKSRNSSLSSGQSSADAYWGRVTGANDALKEALYGKDGNGGLLGNNGEFAQSITDYKAGVQAALDKYNDESQKAIDKYSGENAFKEINRLASEGAQQQAAKAGAEKLGAMRSMGGSTTANKALVNSSLINDYNAGLQNQQALASNQYSNALNASMNKYGTALQGQLSKEQGVLGAQGNRIGQAAQGYSALAQNTIGGAGQNVTNYQNQTQVAQNSQNLIEKLHNSIFGNIFG